MTNDELAEELEKANSKIMNLHRRLARMEKSRSQTDLPNTMILSPSFIKRAFAVYGHTIVASFLIAIPIWILMFLLTLFMSALVY